MRLLIVCASFVIVMGSATLGFAETTTTTTSMVPFSARIRVSAMHPTGDLPLVLNTLIYSSYHFNRWFGGYTLMQLGSTRGEIFAGVQLRPSDWIEFELGGGNGLGGLPVVGANVRLVGLPFGLSTRETMFVEVLTNYNMITHIVQIEGAAKWNFAPQLLVQPWFGVTARTFGDVDKLAKPLEVGPLFELWIRQPLPWGIWFSMPFKFRVNRREMLPFFGIELQL